MLKQILKFVHLQVWRRLPHVARRTALFKFAAWRAPAITRGAKAVGPIIIVGMLRHASGLGAAARACHDSLKKAGIPVLGLDLTTRLFHEPNVPDFAFEDAAGHIGEGTILLHVSGPLVPLAMSFLGRRFIARKRVIAHWFWELPRMPMDWLTALPFIHEIWVNTRFVEEAAFDIADGRPVRVLSYPLRRASPARAQAENPSRPFTALVILNVASSFARKNPIAAIAAFKQAFGDDPSARLVVKYMNAFAWPHSVPLLEAATSGASNIELIGEVLDVASMDALYERSDVVISLHRSEGLGLVVAEAMLRGMPAIATNWSGNVDFLTRETGMPVGFTLVPVKDPQGNYMQSDVLWAEADIGEAAAALRTLKADPALRHTLGKAAATHAAAFFDPARYVSQVVEVIDGTAPKPV